MNTAMRTLNHISSADMPVINNSSCKNCSIFTQFWTNQNYM